MTATLQSLSLPQLQLFRRGKVRDTYVVDGNLLMVATDRISAFDVVLPTPIPRKGIVLTQLSRFWFDLTKSTTPNHLITADPARFPEELKPFLAQLSGRSMLVKLAERIDIECVVRGFLAGSAWAEYRTHGTVAGESMPAGMRQAERLPEPIFTPAMKADSGHDVNISITELRGRIGEELATQLETASKNVYEYAADFAARRGILIADTKFEFGFVDGELTLIDEVLTPDSSRFWDAAFHQPSHRKSGRYRSRVSSTRPGSAELRQAIHSGLAGVDRVGQDATGTRRAAERRGRHRRSLSRSVQTHNGFAALATGGAGIVTSESIWNVDVIVMPKNGVNDPEGEAILGGLKMLGYDSVGKVRAGRLIRLEIAAADEAKAKERASAMADQLLANPVIEVFDVTVAGRATEVAAR